MSETERQRRLVATALAMTAVGAMLAAVALFTVAALEATDGGDNAAADPRSTADNEPEPPVISDISGLLARDTPEPKPDTETFTPWDEIYIRRADGSDERNLAIGFRPAWSNAGDRIAFGVGNPAHLAGEALIRTVPIDGGSLVRVGNAPYTDTRSCYNWHIGWSPEDTVLTYFDSTRGETRIGRADGAGEQVLTAGCPLTLEPDGWRALVYYLRRQWVVDIRSGDLGSEQEGELGAWSPNGDLIASMQYKETLGQLLIAEAGSGDILRTLELPDKLEDRLDQDPVSWSPDGERVVVSLNDRMYVVDVRTGEAEWIGHGLHPAWSPTGESIAFNSGQFGHEIYLVAPEAGSYAKFFAEGRRPTWSPDGEWIAFTR